MNLTDKIRTKALRVGFDACGIARSRPLRERREPFAEWLEKGYHGSLAYLQRNVDMRLDPGLLMEGARSVVVCAVSYNRPAPQGALAQRIASYAHTRDYHLTIREMLNELADYLRELVPGAAARAFVDTAPLLEKSWAAEAGLGWIGRHSLLVHPDLGSFILLGEVVTTAELQPDAPYTRDGCGKCRACIDACPAGAILPGRQIDANRCISRRTIEKGEHSDENLHGWLFGCDLCQRACPHNRRAPVPGHESFRSLPELERMSEDDFLNLTRKQFGQLFGDTPLSRCGWERICARIRESGDDNSSQRPAYRNGTQ